MKDVVDDADKSRADTAANSHELDSTRAVSGQVIHTKKDGQQIPDSTNEIGISRLCMGDEIQAEKRKRDAADEAKNLLSWKLGQGRGRGRDQKDHLSTSWNWTGILEGPQSIVKEL